jgi:hypothetical protein
VAGHQRVVRHEHLPVREIMTGIGPVAVRQPRVRDREPVGGERIRFSPSAALRPAHEEPDIPDQQRCGGETQSKMSSMQDNTFAMRKKLQMPERTYAFLDAFP